jgi:GT2 family glycosyltransferase
LKVLFGIPTFGRNELAKKSVRSALEQSRRPDEIRVVEEAGTSEPFRWEGPEMVRITRNEQRGGPLLGRNQMMLESDADIFIGLDDDSYFLDPDVIEKAEEIFTTSPKVGALYFEVLLEGGEGRKERTPPRQVRTFVGCGCALRIRAVKEVGGYEKLPGLFYGEESDLALRLLDRGWETWKVPGYHVWHARKFLQRSRQDRAAERMWGTMNDLALIFRHCPGLAMWGYLFGNLLNHILFLLRSPAERLTPTLVGIGKFLRGLPKAVHTRKPVRLETWHRYRNLG